MRKVFTHTKHQRKIFPIRIIFNLEKSARSACAPNTQKYSPQFDLKYRHPFNSSISSTNFSPILLWFIWSQERTRVYSSLQHCADDAIQLKKKNCASAPHPRIPLSPPSLVQNYLCFLSSFHNLFFPWCLQSPAAMTRGSV